MFPRFLSLGPIEQDHYRFFLVLNHCAVLGFLFHALMIPLFMLLGVGLMAAFNVISTFVWAAALLVNRQGRHTIALLLVLVEVIVHSTLAVLEVGSSSGFHYYLLLAPPMLFFSPLPVRFKLAVLTTACGSLAGLQILDSFHLPNHPLATNELAWLGIGNLVTAFLVLAALSYYYHYVAQRAEAALHKINAELARLASTDPLTGLMNRRRMGEELNRETERFLRTRRPFALLLADIDDFKRINDQFGHEAGDHVLQQFATLLGGATRQMDRVARWGGEEFLVLLPETDQAGALNVAEKIRIAVAAHPISYESQPFAPTVTIGLAVLADGEAVDRCILRADTALYRGKQAGKNRVVAA